MNLRKSLLDLLSSTKGVDTSNLTKNQQYNIELLEQRIMYSATQAGAALGGEAGMDMEHFENLCADSGIQELFGNFDQDVDQGQIENFVNDLFAFLAIEQRFFCIAQVFDNQADFFAKLVALHVSNTRQVQFVD